MKTLTFTDTHGDKATRHSDGSIVLDSRDGFLGLDSRDGFLGLDSCGRTYPDARGFELEGVEVDPSDGEVFVEVRTPDGFTVCMSFASAGEAEAFVEALQEAGMPCPGYYAAKHDQGKPNPLTDPRVTGDFWRRVLVANEVSLGGEWRQVLDTLGHPHNTLGIAEAMHYGAQKYEWDSWRTVPEALARYKAACMRHFLYELYYPEDAETGVDSESGIPHLSLAACNVAFVMELERGQ